MARSSIAGRLRGAEGLATCCSTLGCAIIGAKLTPIAGSPPDHLAMLHAAEPNRFLGHPALPATRGAARIAVRDFDGIALFGPASCLNRVGCVEVRHLVLLVPANDGFLLGFGHNHVHVLARGTERPGSCSLPTRSVALAQWIVSVPASRSCPANGVSAPYPIAASKPAGVTRYRPG